MPLMNIAHPDFRDDPVEAAREMSIWVTSNNMDAHSWQLDIKTPTDFFCRGFLVKDTDHLLYSC